MNPHHQRSMYTQYQFDETFQRIPKKDSTTHQNWCTKRPQCSKSRAKNFLFERLPALHLLCTYQWKKWLLWDMIAGLSVGVIHIPQGMGFALVTAVPPALGLYSSLFPPLFYFLFGTSRHISIGTMAVISILIGNVVNREVGVMSQTMWSNETTGTNGETMGSNDTQSSLTNTPSPVDLEAFKVDIATSVTLLMGAFQVCKLFCLYILRPTKV